MANRFRVSPLRIGEGVAGAGSVGVWRVRLSDFRDRRDDFSGYADSLARRFRAMSWVTTQKNGASALGLQRVLGLKKYETAWTRR